MVNLDRSYLPAWALRTIGVATIGGGAVLAATVDAWQLGLGALIVGLLLVIAPDEAVGRTLRWIDRHVGEPDRSDRREKGSVPPRKASTRRSGRDAQPSNRRPGMRVQTEHQFESAVADLVKQLAKEERWTFYGRRPHQRWCICLQSDTMRLAIQPCYFPTSDDATPPDLEQLDHEVAAHSFADFALVISNRTPSDVDVRSTDARTGPVARSVWRFWIPGNEKSSEAIKRQIRSLMKQEGVPSAARTG